MEDIANVINNLVLRSIATNEPDANDYRDDKDYLICGKCGTRREVEIEIPNFPAVNTTVRRRVPCLCLCRTIARDRAEQAAKAEKEMHRISALKRQSLMDERLLSATFEQFRETDKNKRNLRICKNYVDQFQTMIERNQGLLFYGGVGTGKTFAAACIANELLNRRVPVVMTSFVKLLEAMKGYSENDELILRLNRAKLLVIDDLGVERSTDYAIERVYDVIDSRYRAKLPMILTSNLSIDDMKQTTDLRYARIYDRVYEMCYPVQFVGMSWRKTEAARRYKDIGALLEA